MSRPSRLVDDEAEHHLAGIAAISVSGAQLALERVAEHHFHDPVAWWVIDAAASLPNDLPGDDPDPIDRRIEAIAATVDIYPALLRQWVAETPAMWDQGGQIAGRVLAAAERRRVAEEHIEALRELGFHVRWTSTA